MRRAELSRAFLVLMALVVLGWAAFWFYRAPERLTQEIWEDAIARSEVSTEPTWIGRHSRRGEHNARCEWWALQSISLADATQDHAEVLAASYERDGRNVTRLIGVLNDNYVVFAITPDRSQQVNAKFQEPLGAAITASHDPGNCPLLSVDGLNYEEDRWTRVDVFPTG